MDPEKQHGLTNIIEARIVNELRPSSLMKPLLRGSLANVKPLTRRQRWRYKRQWWWNDHRPHFHLGPCDSDD